MKSGQILALTLASHLALWGGQTADVVTTAQAFGRGCQERNTLMFGSDPGIARIVATKTLFSLGISAVMLWADKKGHTKSAKFVGFFGGGIGAAAAIHNIGVVCQ